MAKYRKKKVYITQKVGGPEIGAAHKSQKVDGPSPLQGHCIVHIYRVYSVFQKTPPFQNKPILIIFIHGIPKTFDIIFYALVHHT